MPSVRWAGKSPRAVLDALVTRLRGPDQAFARTLPGAREALDTFCRRARRLDDSADVGEASLLLAQALMGLHNTEGRGQAAEQAWRSLKEQFGEDSPQAQRARTLIG